MEDSMERIVPDAVEQTQETGLQSLELHLERYHFAGKNLTRGSVADVACGAGYGSYLLATEYSHKATNIIAVDNDAAAINYATNRYGDPKIKFIKADITKFIPEVKVQNIVCLETLEHLPDPFQFVRHIANHLQAGGLFIASVPITPSMDANPFHLHDFTEKSFKKLFITEGFTELASIKQVQPFSLQTVLMKKEKRTGDMRKSILKYYLSNPSKFFLRLRSLLTDGLQNKYIVTVFQKL